MAAAAGSGAWNPGNGGLRNPLLKNGAKSGLKGGVC